MRDAELGYVASMSVVGSVMSLRTKAERNGLSKYYTISIVIAPQSHDNRQSATGWIGRRYLEHFRDQPNWPLLAMHNKINRYYNYLSKPKMWRARRIAKKYV